MAETTPKQGFNLGEFLQKNTVVILAFIAFVMWYTKKPATAPGQLISSDTTRTQVLQPIVINPAYTPTQSGSTVYVPIPNQYQPVTPATDMTTLIEQVKELSARVEYLAKEYYAQKNYKDSITLKDTAGNRVGVVNLDQDVSENTLKSTQSSYQLLFPKVTITNVMAAKLKNQWFIGGGVQANLPIATPNQAKLGVLIKNKRETVIGFSGTYDFKNRSPGLEVSFYKKISFKPLMPKL